MTEPRRWRDRDGEAPPGARALFDAARKTRPMTAAERERSARRIARIAAVPAAAGLLATLKGLAAAAGFGAGSALALIGAYTAVEARLKSTSDLNTPVHASARLPSSALTGAPPSSPEVPSGVAAGPVSAGPSLATTGERGPGARPPGERDTPASAPGASGGDSPSPAGEGAAGEGAPSSSPSAPPPGVSAGSSTPEADPLLREARLLDEARGLLAARPAEALARLDEHARLFPGGKLALEREFLVIDALGRLGRGAEARARGEALLARSAGTPYEKRVRARLESPR